MKTLIYKYPCLPLESDIHIEFVQVDGTIEQSFDFKLGDALNALKLQESIKKKISHKCPDSIYDLEVTRREDLVEYLQYLIDESEE